MLQHWLIKLLRMCRTTWASVFGVCLLIPLSTTIRPTEDDQWLGEMEYYLTNPLCLHLTVLNSNWQEVKGEIDALVAVPTEYTLVHIMIMPKELFWNLDVSDCDVEGGKRNSDSHASSRISQNLIRFPIRALGLIYLFFANSIPKQSKYRPTKGVW